MNDRPHGFTLVELLLAMTLAAMVATSALGALGLFAEADAELVHGGETEVDVARALRLLRADVQAAATIDVQSQRWSITRDDGSAVVWVTAAGETELHRLAASDLATVLLQLATLLATTVPTAEFDARGHLRDDSYRANAVLQGVSGIAATAVTSPVDGDPVGLCVRITHAAANGTRTTAGTAVSLRLAEEHGRR